MRPDRMLNSHHSHGHGHRHTMKNMASNQHKIPTLRRLRYHHHIIIIMSSILIAQDIPLLSFRNVNCTATLYNNRQRESRLELRPMNSNIEKRIIPINSKTASTTPAATISLTSRDGSQINKQMASQQEVKNQRNVSPKDGNGLKNSKKSQEEARYPERNIALYKTTNHGDQSRKPASASGSGTKLATNSNQPLGQIYHPTGPINKLATLSSQLDHGNQISKKHYLPSGPPPFRPSSILLGLASATGGGGGGGLGNLRRSLAFKRFHKSKVYYLFLDLLRHLTILVDRFAQKKLDTSSPKWTAFKSIFRKLGTWRGVGGHHHHLMKLKWPLVLLNPQFLKEILSSPTFLVMLFHAVEVAYTSLPKTKFWLKPLLKLIEQPSAEKEERIWWHRKRLYDTFNGHRSSELQPNLKTEHFKRPGQFDGPYGIPSPIVNLIKQAAKIPDNIDPTYYRQPSMHQASSAYQEPFSFHHLREPKPIPLHYVHSGNRLPFAGSQHTYQTEEPMAPSTSQLTIGDEYQQQDMPSVDNINSLFNYSYNISAAASDIDLKNEHLEPFMASMNHPSDSQDDWLSMMPSNEEQLMSQEEFDQLETSERDFVLNEAKKRLEESRWTNELIRHHGDLVESLIKRQNVD